MNQEKVLLLRYPGGKQRLLNHLIQYLPNGETIEGRFVEPFLGGGAVFFALNPKRSLLADLNSELIDLYRGIRRYPSDVWRMFCAFPSTKKGYYKVRNVENKNLKLSERAARTLYLNRTCFKGMWRHNSKGQFNVGYGGQARRWVISKEILFEVSKRLKRASLLKNDFEEVIDTCTKKDFLFLDPPYCPGAREMVNNHYGFSSFRFNDQVRLAKALNRASRRKVKWAMTTSSHPDILELFSGNTIVSLPRGTGKSPGILTNISGEALICNYEV